MLYKEKRNGADYIRIEYADSEAVGILLSQDAEKTGENSACIPAAAFRLPDFYDRYSPHAYIDYSRVYVRASQAQKGIHTAGRLSGTAGAEALQPLDH